VSFIDPEIKHHFSSGVYAKEMKMPADYLMLHHKHTFSHLSILASGSIELIVDNVKKIVHAPACLTINANEHHGIKSLTDVVWYCIHATDCTDEDKIDEALTEPNDMSEVLSIAQNLVKEH
jgi:mannose-6-phosphate isomerase-like protein (cupin superfamily)